MDAAGNEYVIVTRNAEMARRRFPRASAVVAWDLPGRELDASALDGIDGVIHMAGATVAQRWTADTRRAIRESRTVYTRGLVDALGRTSTRPPILVSFSAIGYYGARDDRPLNESADPGDDFLAEVCKAWESEAARAAELGIRVVNPRVGIVVGRGGGALAQMLTPFRLGIGGPIGNGRQWMSWIHVADVVGLTMHALKDKSLTGPVNATSPEPVTNREFSKTLGRVLHRPAILPIPVFGLRMLFGGFADILATGQRIVPEKALEAGYRFRYRSLEQALADAVR
jgi:hypothetical protein